MLKVAAEFEGRGVTDQPLLWGGSATGLPSIFRYCSTKISCARDLVPRQRRPGRRAGSVLVVVDYKTGSSRPFKMDIHTKVRGRFGSSSKEAEWKLALCRVLSGLLDKLRWYAATGRRLGVVMTVLGHLIHIFDLRIFAELLSSGTYDSVADGIAYNTMNDAVTATSGGLVSS